MDNMIVEIEKLKLIIDHQKEIIDMKNEEVSTLKKIVDFLQEKDK